MPDGTSLGTSYNPRGFVQTSSSGTGTAGSIYDVAAEYKVKRTYTKQAGDPDLVVTISTDLYAEASATGGGPGIGGADARGKSGPDPNAGGYFPDQRHLDKLVHAAYPAGPFTPPSVSDTNANDLLANRQDSLNQTWTLVGIIYSYSGRNVNQTPVSLSAYSEALLSFSSP